MLKNSKMKNDNHSKFTNHTCIIYKDAEGKDVAEPKPQPYTLMKSGDYAEPNLTYLGYGEAVSVTEIGSKQTFPISGKGHFFK